jgi:hypothetical protein
MPTPEWIKELRPHITWDTVKEGGKLMLPFLAGLGIKAWISVHATALMWTAAFVVTAIIAFWGKGPKLKINSRTMALETIAGVDYRDRSVIVDGKNFIDCSFTNVVFKWQGEPFMMTRGRIEGPRRLEVASQTAAEVIDFLKGLGFLSEEFASSWRRQTN